MLQRLIYLFEKVNCFDLDRYCDRFEVSKRTAFRDMRLLKDDYGFVFKYDKDLRKYLITRPNPILYRGVTK